MVKKSNEDKKKVVSRRSFLKAAAVTTGAATLGFPSIVKAQGPITMRWQSTWPTKDIFHEYALDFAKRVNDMTGGDLKIEVLPAGAVVPAFNLLDAVSKGTLDGGHGVMVYHYGKQNALALWGSSPAFGMDANMLLAWHKYGGGKALLDKIYDVHRRERSFFPLRPDGDPAPGLVQEADHQGGGLQGPQIPHRGHFHRSLHRPGRGGERASRRRDRAGPGPWPAGWGGVQQRQLRPAARFSRRVQGVHAPELPPERGAFEILFNKDKFKALPPKIQAQIESAVEAASADMWWKSVDRYSKDYIELQTKDKVKMYKTPDSILQKQLDIFDEVMEKYSAKNPMFKEVVESQKVFAKRAVSWYLDTMVNPRMAYNHYFGAKKAPAKAAPARPRRRSK